MYKYASKKEIRNTKNYAERVINALREPLRKEGFTFSYFLAGSGKRKLVTKNIKTNVFDLDYQIVFKKTKNKNIKITPKIKGLVVNMLNKIKSGSSKINDSTSSIHYFVSDNYGNVIIESDIAIFIECNKEKYHIKGKGGSYFKEITDYKNHLFEKLEKLKDDEKIKFKDEYIKLKNKEKEKKSFHILLDLLREI